MKWTYLAVVLFLAPALLAARQRNASTYRIPLPRKPDFSSMEWLVGNWTGQMVKRSPQGRISLSVSFGLDQRVMVFREKVSLAAGGELPATNESSIGILSRAPGSDSFLFQVYSSTGFISRYRVTVAGSEIDFAPDGGLQPPPGWLSRRIIQRGDINGFIETVQLAPPLKPFFNYYVAVFIREPAPEGSQAAQPENQKKPEQQKPEQEAPEQRKPKGQRQ